MQLYITATPEEAATVRNSGFALSFWAYKIASDQHLHRSGTLQGSRNTLLALNDHQAPEISNPSQLCRELLHECHHRGFAGICADFGEEPSPSQISFLHELSASLSAQRKQLYISSAGAKEIPQSQVLINTALSGGTLRSLLWDAMSAFGKERLALDIERLRMDFILPSPTGVGSPLDQEHFEALLHTLHPNVFFSHELCAKYFTYQKDGQSHFVLFDDLDTIRCKLKMGAQLGIGCAFLLYREISDLFPHLISQK